MSDAMTTAAQDVYMRFIEFVNITIIRYTRHTGLMVIINTKYFDVFKLGQNINYT